MLIDARYVMFSSLFILGFSPMVVLGFDFLGPLLRIRGGTFTKILRGSLVGSQGARLEIVFNQQLTRLGKPSLTTSLPQAQR